MNKKVKEMLIVWHIILLPLQVLWGQNLREALDGVFQEVLSDRNLFKDPVIDHSVHFLPSRNAASGTTIDAFSNFISANISSFPLSSTTAGVTYDFSSGVPVSTATSLGPIFAERAQTLGKGRINLAFNFSYLKFQKLRGIDLDKVRFAFTHADIGGPDGFGVESGVIGDDPAGTELDVISLSLNLDFSATIFAFIATYGITNRLDIGVAVPYAAVSIEGTPQAQITPITAITRQGAPVHRYVTGEDTMLSFTQSIKQDAVGIGDIALRAKYNFIKGKSVDFAGLIEYRFSSGDKDDFLGAGDPSFKAQLVFSSIMGNFSPHLNLAYKLNSSDLIRDNTEIFLGFDQKLFEKFTLIVDFLGNFELGNQIEALSFPAPITLHGGDAINPPLGNFGQFSETVERTDIPNFSNDNILNGAVGIKFMPKDGLLLLGNVFVPLNDGGLRADIVPTVGVEFTF